MFNKLAIQSVVASAVLGLALAFSAGSAGAGCDPKHEKCDLAACSPGYYRNHVETWDGICTTSQSETDFLIALLTATGPHNGALKQAAAAILNACFEFAEFSPCEDD